jgi:hypothetical protein
MWWRWAILAVCGIMILACIIGTTVDWIKGKTGPFGPKAFDWWSCGVFTLILLGVMYWAGRAIFFK